MAEAEAQNDEVVLESLPDDVLIKIFQYLPGKELFSVRAVCWRWAELALHPDLWRHRDLLCRDYGFCKAALGLAPCARSLTLRGRPWHPRAVIRAEPELRSTPCPVRTLWLVLDKYIALTCAAALQRQALLGCLRQVDVRYLAAVESESSGQYQAFYRALFATQGLTELSLTIACEQLEWLPEELLVPPSLKKLTFWSGETGPSRFAVLRYLLDAHALALEVLDVSSNPVTTSLSLPSTAWLVKAQRLRELRCPLGMQDIQTLAQFEHLHSLTLVLWAPSNVSGCPGIRKYLRQASQLTSLTLICQNMELAPLALDLVKSAASCRPSALQMLSLDFALRDDRMLEVLLCVFPELEALRELRVKADGAATLRLLECLSAMERPGTSCASSLTLSVECSLSGGDSGCCWHGWLHQYQLQIREFFQAKPALHLKLGGGYNYRCSASSCPASSEDCRFEGAIYSPCVFFGHAESYTCDPPHGLSQNPRGSGCAAIKLKCFVLT